LVISDIIIINIRQKTQTFSFLQKKYIHGTQFMFKLRPSYEAGF